MQIFRLNVYGLRFKGRGMSWWRGECCIVLNEREEYSWKCESNSV